MSPRHFTKAMYGPYYLSAKHYEQPQEPQTKFEKVSFYLLKYTGISKLIDFIKSPAKITNKTEWLPYQGRPDLSE